MLPNFLIVGQVKCGTSSLACYLSQHPEIFISGQKEPRFLSSQGAPLPLGGPRDDAVEAWYVKDFSAYQQLFSAATEPARGDASADTLYFYQYTIPVIRKILGHPRIIILLRDPVQRAFSAWKHLVRDKREGLSFKAGIEQEEARIRKNYELIYHYTAASLYYEPVRAFLESFQDVKVLLTEDLSAKPRELLSEVFKFLNVDAGFVCDTSVKFNMSGIPKNRRWHKVLINPGHPLRQILHPLTRSILPLSWRKKLISLLLSKNYNQLCLNIDLAQQLSRRFEADIARLEPLIKRDLSLWRRPYQQTAALV